MEQQQQQSSLSLSLSLESTDFRSAHGCVPPTTSKKKLAVLKFLTLGDAIARKNQVKKKLRYIIYIYTTAIAHGGRCGGRWRLPCWSWDLWGWQWVILLFPAALRTAAAKFRWSHRRSALIIHILRLDLIMAGVYVTALQSAQHHWQEVRNDQRSTVVRRMYQSTTITIYIFLQSNSFFRFFNKDHPCELWRFSVF
jgi:hypothetical protein